MLVGVDDDWVKWRADTPGLVRIQRDAGFDTVKVMFPWRPGMLHPGTIEQHYISRLSRMSLLRQRVVLAFAGRARHAPRTPRARDQFCRYVRGIVAAVPGARDIVIWNEVNSPSFWRPQRDAPRQYAALLGRCWDELHALRPDVNVISSTAPRHNPLQFVRGVGAAYRASGRTRPLVDTFGHNPYPSVSSESPAAVHENGYVGQGDYDALVRAIQVSFSGTHQPLLGEQGVTIWYLEDGFQTRTPFGRPLYHGLENELALIPALAPGPVVDQVDQLQRALALAYCQQPLVGALFNFQLADERRLAGWQSGLLWANWQPKPSYAPLRDLLAQITSGAYACG
ncbi:MAG TPA: hypothetical protein VGQ84_07570 [Gaiellaceae bacterium]|jgi:hypothetical protein|nr:hypothetical protein [Gaiellaceae bacterium]